MQHTTTQTKDKDKDKDKKTRYTVHKANAKALSDKEGPLKHIGAFYVACFENARVRVCGVGRLAGCPLLARDLTVMFMVVVVSCY